MDKRASSRTDVLLKIAAFVVVVAALRAAGGVLVPFMMALLLAVVSAPPLAWLERRRVPEPVAATLVLLANIAVLTLGATVVAGSATDFGEAVPRYQARIDVLAADLTSWLATHRIHVRTSAIGQMISPGTMLSFGAGMVRDLAGLVSNVFIVLIILGFMLFESRAFSRKLRALAGARGGYVGLFPGIVDDVQNYLFIKTIISIAVGLLAGLIVYVLGVDFALLWGLVAFLLNYIPNVGAIIASVPPVFFALLSHGPGRALAVSAGFLVVHMVLGNILEPAWMGRRLGLSATVVFLSLLFWGYVWGPAGMFLSVPLTMVARILLEGSEKTRWMAMMLDSSAPPDPQPEPKAAGGDVVVEEPKDT
ncbi:AI-2E family transporter [Polyangium spumosum]|uniref:AI-2E family transporter n=1 Tax=Polyangium spumosum TaxID=889282 RepID=UPI001479540E|nr:AI-2E family transporter [Polyangium spumosum]